MAFPGTQMAPSRRSRESTNVGSFTKLEEIGRGSFATVFKATHNKDQTLVAIKSVNLAKLNKKLKDNLTSEISILKGLHHPHIVALIDCKESAHHIHLVMEFVALGDLSYFIKKRETAKDNLMVNGMMTKYPNAPNGGLNEVVVRHLLKHLASALQFLRARNLIHRDLKPQNLLLSPSPIYFENFKPDPMPYLAGDDSLIPTCGVPSLPMLKIADFGFARSLPSTSLAETLCGSPLYMAPEILRYEKYDAKADLWSVGTVLYEMITSKPPFRASNHVELLRRIEKGEDKISFGSDILVSTGLKNIVRALLKRDPKERMSFVDFFSHSVINEEIPDLTPEDRAAELMGPVGARQTDRRKSSKTDPTPLTPHESLKKASALSEHVRSASEDQSHQSNVDEVTQTPQRQAQTTTSRPSTARRNTGQAAEREGSLEDRPMSPTAQRPGLPSHMTAPGRQELLHQNPKPASAAMDRKGSRETPPPPSLIREQVQDRERERAFRRQQELEKERTAQDIAFERDYVVVEKKAVEVNALADELEASPRLQRGAMQQALPTQGVAMVRRATTQGNPTSTTGAQTSASRAVQIASGRPRGDVPHQRQGSYERRYGPSPQSATSAISKALNMASGRFFGMGISPPINFGRGGRSPPVGYSPFPAYPAAQSSLVMVGEEKRTTPLDEDTRLVQNIEDVATRSDVVYGFAEVKYRQLTPTPPSAQTGLGLRRASVDNNGDGAGSGDDGLTVEATVVVSEEALVLYVKALSLLAKSMDIAGGWWARKNRGEVLADLSSPRSTISSMNSATGQRMNNVVQWVRGRFNEVLEKAEVVRLRLLDNQKRLPTDHPCHPNNHAVRSSAGMGTSSDHVVVVSPGVTAEKLMYDRALEMSRTAAINELTGDDLSSCEISYVTAIRMLEAVLESDDPNAEQPTTSSGVDKDKMTDKDDDAPINGLEVEHRKTVKSLVASIRARLNDLRKKLHVIQKRASAPSVSSSNKSSGSPSHRPSAPAIGTTPPKA